MLRLVGLLISAVITLMLFGMAIVIAQALLGLFDSTAQELRLLLISPVLSRGRLARSFWWVCPVARSRSDPDTSILVCGPTSRSVRIAGIFLTY